MKFPTLNINGTARESLLDGYMQAKRRLASAIEYVGNTAPHGRDYQYPGGDADLRIAIEEHAARLLKLRQVQIEIEALAEHVI